MSDLKLYTAATLTDAQLDEYSGLHAMPHNHHRDLAIENFRKTLAGAGIEALLTIGEEIGSGALVSPIEVKIYELHITYECSDSTYRAYGKTQLRALVEDHLYSDLECEDAAEEYMPEDVDVGTFIEFRLDRQWIKYRVKEAVADLVTACTAQPEVPEALTGDIGLA